ncbi:hypothetical protein SJ_222 [Proteus phage SJ_PmiM]|nr:hypothetical protein SJ_222 [Proteus phage SJ_PmiM]
MIENIKFEDLVPGFTFYVGYGTTPYGTSINMVEKYIVTAEPHQESFSFGSELHWWVKCVDKNGYTTQKSLSDMNTIIKGNDSKRYNKNFAFYSFADAEKYTKNWSDVIDQLEVIHLERKRVQEIVSEQPQDKAVTIGDIEKVKEFFASKQFEFTNEPGWETYFKLSKMSDGQMFNSMKSILVEATNMILDEMIKDLEGK